MTSMPMDRLVEIRNVIGITQAHLAAAANISVKTVKRAEAGSPVSAETRMAIMAVLQSLGGDLLTPSAAIDIPSVYRGPMLSLARKARKSVIGAHLLAISVAAGLGLTSAIIGDPQHTWRLSIGIVTYVVIALFSGIASLPFGACLAALSLLVISSLGIIMGFEGLASSGWSDKGWLFDICVYVIYAAFSIRLWTLLDRSLIAFKFNDRGQGLRYGGGSANSSLRT